eukprot:COSAG02_NODE_32255_length_519_cov_0.861905_1_plen_81_part_01
MWPGFAYCTPYSSIAPYARDAPARLRTRPLVMSTWLWSIVVLVAHGTTVHSVDRATSRANPGCSAAGGVDSLNMPGGDLPG